jgi:hypothetical protein
MIAKTPLKIPGLSGLDIDEEMLPAHVMRPQHVSEAKSDRGPQSPGAPAAPRPMRPKPRIGASLDPNLFRNAIVAALGNACVGYSMQLRKNGVVVASQNYGFAQLAGGASSNAAWTFDTPMHVAGLSHNITAMAMTKVLLASGLPATTPIGSYLPNYWMQGQNVSQITFSDLLTHRSGLTSMASDYQSMKAAIAAGVTTRGQQRYANVNFALCRILLSVLNENVSVTLGQFLPGFFDGMLDELWDLATIAAFQQYVATHVFAPSGSAAHLVHEPGDALAYTFPPRSGEAGFDDGDLTTTSGSAGWHMSVNQLLDVIGTFRRAGTILTAAQAQRMLDDGLGIDWIQQTAIGVNYYAKYGLWEDGIGQAEQGILFYLPDDFELVMLVNSPTTGRFLYTLVADAYDASIV